MGFTDLQSKIGDLGNDFIDFKSKLFEVLNLFQPLSRSTLRTFELTLEHSCKIARKGFAYLIGSYSITPKRLEIIESHGFKLTHMHICKVSQWFGMTAFCIFEKSTAENMKFTYDRKVWQSKELYKGSNLKEKTIMEFE